MQKLSLRLVWPICLIILMIINADKSDAKELSLPSASSEFDPIRIDMFKKDSTYSLYAFSDQWAEASLKFLLTGSNVSLTLVSNQWRSLSRDLSDPICVFEAVDPKTAFILKPRIRFHIGHVKYGPFVDSFYELPYPKGTCYRVTQGFLGPSHNNCNTINAVDFDLHEGDLVCASRNGKVIGLRANSTVGGADSSFSNKANYIVLEHDDDTYTEYLHLKPNSNFVNLGETVFAGQHLALAGNTGQSTSPHLHFCAFGFDKEHQRYNFAVRFRTKRGVVQPQMEDELESINSSK